MDDLSERDLSDVADEDLTPEERQELQRRMDEFVDRMQIQRHKKPSQEAKAKPEPEPESKTGPKCERAVPWDPASAARRH